MTLLLTHRIKQSFEIFDITDVLQQIRATEVSVTLKPVMYTNFQIFDFDIPNRVKLLPKQHLEASNVLQTELYLEIF